MVVSRAYAVRSSSFVQIPLVAQIEPRYEIDPLVTLRFASPSRPVETCAESFDSGAIVSRALHESMLPSLMLVCLPIDTDSWKTPYSRSAKRDVAAIAATRVAR